MNMSNTDLTPLCPHGCGDTMVWQECEVCDGDGYMVEIDGEPVNYSTECLACDGDGGYWHCIDCGYGNEQP